jgi:Mg2+/citrate symporter
MRRNSATLALIVIVTFMFAGCASVPLASKTLDRKAKRFTVPPDQANIYVTRASIMGHGVLYDVVFDGRMVGSLAYGTFHCIKARPGNHTLAVRSVESQDIERISTKASKIYYFDVEPGIGFVAPRPKIRAMNATEGQEVVKSLDLAQKVH